MRLTSTTRKAIQAKATRAAGWCVTDAMRLTGRQPWGAQQPAPCRAADVVWIPRGHAHLYPELLRVRPYLAILLLLRSIDLTLIQLYLLLVRKP
eukprot:9473893-Pyramimonas_sp.AAC.2